MRVLRTLVLLLLLAGCEQPAPYVGEPTRGRELTEFIRTSAYAYPAGAVVSLQVTNPTRYMVGYKLCRSTLEYGDDRRRVQTTLAEVCTAELRTLAPGQAATYAFRSSPHLKPGPYRITTQLVDPRGVVPPVEVTSNTFQIQRESND